jgi:uncharacterized membrane protein
VEAIFFLIASLFGLIVFVGPIVSILGFVRSRGLKADVEALRRTVDALERKVQTLSTRVADAPERAAAEQRPVATRATAPPTPVAPPIVRPTPPAATPPAATSPGAVGRIGVPPAVVTPPVTGAPAVPPPVPPSPPQRTPAPPPPPPAPAFDWESLLGVRGAAWLGGVTLVVAALFFAKWSIDQGFFTPTLRVALMLLAGTGALVWAELSLRRGYEPTANAISGAGVVTLYAAFVAGHRLYQLFGVEVAFAGMAITTAAGAAVAVRHEALFTAILGLLGGLATPILLSTGADRPVGFFSYLLVLTAGFTFVAHRRGWTVITVLCAVGATLLQLGWYANYMAPDLLAVRLSGFAVIAAVFTWHAVRTPADDDFMGHAAALGAAMLPLGLVALLTADSRFAAEWPIVLGYFAAVGVALFWAARRYDLPFAGGVLAVATGVTVAMIGGSWLAHVPSAWMLALACAALTAAISLLPATPLADGVEWLDDDATFASIVRLVPLAGFFAFAWRLVGIVPAPWLVVGVVAVIFALTVSASSDRRRGLLALGAVALTVLCNRWFDRQAQPGAYLSPLVLPHLVAVAVALVVARRHLAARAASPAGAWWQRDDLAVVAAAVIAYLGLVATLDSAVFAAPQPLFALLAVDVTLVLLAALSAGWTGLVPAAAAASVLFSLLWHRHVTDALAPFAAGAYVAIYAVFVVLPFAVTPRLRPAWPQRPWPWLTAALIGPAMFLLFYDLWSRVWGLAWIGALPVLLAAVSVATLYGISVRFAAGADAADAQRRLDYLALFAAVALGFVATAIPLQLDRQWITIGWALEAAAVWWLFGLLPHPGLKYFGLALYAAVGLRLLANPEVLRYEPRGGPVINWLLYTYGVPAIACLVGAWWLRNAERERGPLPTHDVLAGDRQHTAGAAGFLGLLMIFWLVNLEIADFYSAGRYVELDLSRDFRRDLTRSLAWGLYAIVLLVIGMVRKVRPLRLVALGFLLLTVGKVFVYDLGQLTGIYRILSFVALGAALILVSLLYQRFARRDEAVAS